MKKIAALFVIAQFLLFSAFVAPAQTNSNNKPEGKWIRVHSDDSEFSIEVPEKFKFYRSEKGYLQTTAKYEDELKNMRMLNTYQNGTLLSFEIYEGRKRTLDEIYLVDISGKKGLQTSEINRTDHIVRQITVTTAKYFLIRQYFSSKKNIYVLTAASRSKETFSMKRFFDSVRFNPDSIVSSEPGEVLISSLQFTDIVIEQDLKSKLPKLAAINEQLDEPKDPNIMPAIIVSKPKPSYTLPARMAGVAGTNRLKVTLGLDGYPEKIVVLGPGLGGGLLRQNLFATIRLKFIPQENAGVPETKIVTMEYTFSLY